MMDLNVRDMFIPDDERIIIDADLKKADFHIVAWEAEDDKLKEVLRAGEDPYAAAAEGLDLDKHAQKIFVHGTNYGGGARTIAIQCGLRVVEAEKAQEHYFKLHPGIKDWHHRVEYRLPRANNIFGYSITFVDRVEGLLPKALAWIPQSTVAIVTNRMLLNLSKLDFVEILLQNHDSLVYQLPTTLSKERLGLVSEALTIEVPYKDKLVIPLDIKESAISWGDCK